MSKNKANTTGVDTVLTVLTTLSENLFFFAPLAPSGSLGGRLDLMFCT
jgi:hypothetical protein